MTPVLDALRGPGPCARTALAFAEASAHLAPPALGRLLQEARAVLDSAGGTAWLAEAIERAVEPGDDAPDAAGFDAAHAAYCALLAGRIVASGKPARAARRELEEISAAAARAAIAALLGTRTDLDPQGGLSPSLAARLAARNALMGAFSALAGSLPRAPVDGRGAAVA